MKVAKEVLGVISVAAVSGNAVRLVGQLDRTLYVATDKVLQAAGGKWNKKEKAHVFDGDAESRIDQIILTGDVVVPKDEYNYFPTPSALVDRIMQIADVQPGMRCLEPSAGKGAIANSLIIATGSSELVDCIELMPENVRHLRGLGLETLEGDFLGVVAIKLYDRIVMNPPFAKQADIKHVMHALNFLKSGGLLVSIMGAGVVFRENKLAVEFRALTEERGGSIEDLPGGSFKESGTMVNTVVVTIPA